MSHRKEQKEALRREREQRERKASESQQRKRLVGIGAAAALALAAIVVIVAVAAGGGGGDEASADMLPDGGEVPEQEIADLAPAAEAAGCELRAVKGSGTASHTGDLDAKIKYNSNPPTTGRHYNTPAEDGAYGEAPKDTQLVHTLEHGRVIVWFKPGLPDDARADLKALFDEDSYQMVLVPRRDMSYEVAASAWNREPEPNGTGRLLTCERFGPGVFDALRSFRDEHRSNGPEPVP